MEDSNPKLFEKLFKRAFDIEQKIDVIVDGAFSLPAWMDGSAYIWDKFGKNYVGEGLRGKKKALSREDISINRKK